MRELEIFSDYVCPWCYLSTARTARLVREYEVNTVTTLFPLHPDTPEEGLTLEELFADRGFNLDTMKQRLVELMEQEGLPYGDRTHTYNSLRAQELGKWADEHHPSSGIHDALFHAYFADSRNIADLEVLVEVAESVGLPSADAREALESRSHQPAVYADWARASTMGVTEVPTFVVGSRALIGAQPYEAFEELVVRAGAKRR